MIERQYVAAGAKVPLTAREDAVREAVKAAGDGAVGIRADMTREEDVEAMVTRAIDERGRLNVLFNNAVIPRKGLHVFELTMDSWNDVFAICITAPMLSARALLKRSIFIGRLSASRTDLEHQANGKRQIFHRQNYILNGNPVAFKLLGRLKEGPAQ